MTESTAREQGPASAGRTGASREAAMSRRVEETATSLLRLAQDAVADFGQLEAASLNWRPEPDRWSIAQCFEHLIKIQTHYLPTLASLAAGTAESTFWERVSPFSG